MVRPRRDLERMVDEQIRRRGVRDERVLEAMAQVPRHRFVGDAMRHRAYEDAPLPIGEGQTISQPYIVARMLELLRLEGHEVVLDVGAGSGYQTALLALLARRVVAVERVATLARRARARLEKMSIHNAVVICADGTMGWRDEAPYDAVVVAAAAPEVPPLLAEQLADGGRLVIPVGGRETQELRVLVRDGDRLAAETDGLCRFVPLLGRYGWEEDG